MSTQACTRSSWNSPTIHRVGRLEDEKRGIKQEGEEEELSSLSSNSATVLIEPYQETSLQDN